MRNSLHELVVSKLSTESISMRFFATSFSSSVRNLAVLVSEGKQKKTTTPQHVVSPPSRKKRYDHLKKPWVGVTWNMPKENSPPKAEEATRAP